MNYELCKKLKDDGFPQPEGDFIGGLELGYIDTKRNIKTWYAHNPKKEVGGDGSTPEEAVAELWFALREK